MKVNLKHAVKDALLGSVVLLSGVSIVGCGKNEKIISTPSLLDGTILEDTYVITDSNDDIFIVRPTQRYQGEDIFSFFDNYANHYIDILSSNCYHEKNKADDVCQNDKYGIFSMDIKQREPISVYLTTEDLLKREFSDEDVVQIIQRVRDSHTVNINIVEKGVEYTK